MSFAWPHLFWLLLLPIGCLISELTRRVRTSGSRHPKMLRAEASLRGLELRPITTGGTGVPRVRGRLWLGLILTIVAFARPQWGEVEEPVFEQAREILIGVDLSKSMLAADIAPTRLDRAKLLITGLLQRLEGERVGLAVFAGTAFLQSPLSADYEILREFLPALNPEFLPEGGTDYAALLDTALDAFSPDSNADRFLIILSDGESQTEAWRQRLDALQERGIRVISLGIGTPAGAMLPDDAGGFIKDERGAVVLSRLSPATLEELARRTSGVYRDASTWVDLADVLQQTVEAGRAGAFSESRRARRIERFQWALGPALLFLLWSVWREFPVRPRQRAITIRPLAGTGAALVVLGMGLIATPPRAAAVEVVPPPPLAEDAPDLEAPLTELISRLASQTEVSPTEFAAVAEETLTWGHQVVQTGQVPPPAVIYDALHAVDLGELKDANAADWSTLREELEKLLEQSQPPPHQPQEGEDESEQSDEGESEEDSENEQNGEGESGESDQQGDAGENGESGQEGESGQDGDPGEQGESGEQDNANEQGDEPSPSDRADDPERDPSEGAGDPEAAPESPSEEERQNAQNAFDNFEEPPAESDEPETEAPASQSPPAQPHPGNQSIGGQQVQDQEAQNNPELVVPLQKLDQLKDQDSPAHLFQLMQDPAAQPPADGRDW